MFEIYRFENFQLNKNNRSLFRQGKQLHLSQRAFEILLFLVERSGEIITKEILLDEIWNDGFVEEGNLAVHMSALRNLLGEKRGEYKYIQTVTGKGYCFVANVEKQELSNYSQVTEQKKKFEDDLSIAVLPFLTKTENSQINFLAEGITESLISNLSQLSQLKVMAYSAVSRYKGQEPDIQETAFILGVSKILCGRISEIDGIFELSVELINASDLTQIWGEQYEFKLEDLFKLKRDISYKIVESLKLKLTKSQTTKLDKQYTSNTTAYKLYLQGRHLLDRRTKPELLKSIEYFEQALKLDSKFALAYTGLADSYNLLGNFFFLPAKEVIPKAKSAIQTALTIDENLSEAYSSLGFLHIFYDYSPTIVKTALEKALELNPNNAQAHSRYSIYYLNFNNREKSLFHQYKALEFDPLSIHYNYSTATRYLQLREFSRAIAQCEETLSLYPNYPYCFYGIASANTMLGNFDEAKINIDKALSIAPMLALLELKGHILALAGDEAGARKILNELVKESKNDMVDFMNIAHIYSALGENDNAFEYLEKAREARMNHFCILKVDARFDKLRLDPRFEEFLKKIGL